MSYKRKGVGTYENSGDWTWRQFPPPYTAWGPQSGLGCGSCGWGSDLGLGQTGFLGTGLFSSADPTTWGMGEYAALAVGGYVAFSLVGDTGRGITRGKRVYSRAKNSAGAGSLGTIALIGALSYGAYYLYQQSRGLGDYQHQGFVNPQILKDATRSAEILIPDGWGGGCGCGA